MSPVVRACLRFRLFLSFPFSPFPLSVSDSPPDELELFSSYFPVLSSFIHLSVLYLRLI